MLFSELLLLLAHPATPAWSQQAGCSLCLSSPPRSPSTCWYSCLLQPRRMPFCLWAFSGTRHLYSLFLQTRMLFKRPAQPCLLLSLVFQCKHHFSVPGMQPEVSENVNIQVMVTLHGSFFYQKIGFSLWGCSVSWWSVVDTAKCSQSLYLLTFSWV